MSILITSRVGNFIGFAVCTGMMMFALYGVFSGVDDIDLDSYKRGGKATGGGAPPSILGHYSNSLGDYGKVEESKLGYKVKIYKNTNRDDMKMTETIDVSHPHDVARVMVENNLSR